MVDFCYCVAVLKETLLKKKLPDAPGVYFFLGKRKEILYIGKATSLRSRVRSYFAPDLRVKRNEIIEKMVADSLSLDYIKTDSVLEALILETNLIRTHKPRCNTNAKDDKSFNHLVITNEEFPRALVVRGKDIATKFSENEISYVFGPFTSGMLFREALKIVKRIFQFYDTEQPVDAMTSKLGKGVIDFNRQIGLYPSEATKEEYKQTIRHLRLFFEGKKATIIKELTRDMKTLAKNERFEAAGAVKRKIFALQHIQDVSLIRDESRDYMDDRRARIEAYDVAHLAGEAMVGVMTVVEAGVINRDEYRKFNIKTVTGANDGKALEEMLERRLAHPEWQLPQIIVVDGNSVQKKVAESVLSKNGVVIPVVAVVKDEKHRPKRIIASKQHLELYESAILLANAEAHRFSIAFHRDKHSKRLLA